MSRRVCLAAVVVLLCAAAVLGFADAWLPAGLCAAGCMYFAGRFDHQRRLAEVTAERDAAWAREQRLDDELNDRWGCRRNGVGYLSASALSDRESNTTAKRGAARAGVRPARLP